MHSLDPLDTVRERTVGPHKLPVVNVRYQGHTIGLYGIREVGSKTVVLHPGPTSIPVGTQVLVEDLFGLIPGTHATMMPATVIRDGGQRLTLSL
jgi:hypothetical protein